MVTPDQQKYILLASHKQKVLQKRKLMPDVGLCQIVHTYRSMALQKWWNAAARWLIDTKHFLCVVVLQHHCRLSPHYINTAIISITLSLWIFYEACLDTWKKVVVMWWSCFGHILGTLRKPPQQKTNWLTWKNQVSFSRTHPISDQKYAKCVLLLFMHCRNATVNIKLRSRTWIPCMRMQDHIKHHKWVQQSEWRCAYGSPTLLYLILLSPLHHSSVSTNVCSGTIRSTFYQWITRYISLHYEHKLL